MIFGFKNAKTNFLKKISTLIAVFTGDYKQQLFGFLLITDFFFNFPRFRKSSAAHTEIFLCVLFHVKMRPNKRQLDQPIF